MNYTNWGMLMLGINIMGLYALSVTPSKFSWVRYIPSTIGAICGLALVVLSAH